MRRGLVASVTLVALATGCSGADLGMPDDPLVTTLTATPSANPSTSPSPGPPRHFEADRAMRTVRHLAEAIGPRLATGPAFRQAATYVEERFVAEGYAVRRQSFRVPGGDSWGVPVDAGRSSNVVATPGDFDPAAPYVLVGAHLDTVAVAPGAEDNASGISVLLELGRVLAGSGQVVLVAFGGEEPRGPGELHHFGSKAYVARLGEAGTSLRAMVSLDRVGVGTVVPLSSVEGTPAALRDRLADVARGIGVPTLVETDAASDHESFADAGFLAARIGSTPYAGYHSASDVPAVVNPAQLRRVGRILVTWVKAALRAS
jgi:hypothetical protein